MPCYSPLQAYRGRHTTASGKREIVFDRNAGYADQPLSLPCGQCVGCRLEKSRQWAMRCLHEASLHEENSFITLTYNDQALPKNYSLDKKAFQLFMKRLRKKHGKGIRFYHCGEYGDKYGRPHYHAIIFGLDWDDKKYLKTTETGFRLYTSKKLASLWPFGHSSTGGVTFESAAYVARYVMKKINGEKADEHYETFDRETGEISQKVPEYCTMSRRPGIGTAFLNKYRADIYPHDYTVVRGLKMKPPKFYDLKLEEEDPDAIKNIKIARKRRARIHASNNTPERLRVRRIIQERKLELLKRNKL